MVCKPGVTSTSVKSLQTQAQSRQPVPRTRRLRRICVPAFCRAHQNVGTLQRSTRKPARLSPICMGLRRIVLITGSLLTAPFVIALAGCASPTVAANPGNAVFAISPGAAAIDTNCNGCNGANPRGLPVHRFAATLRSGSAARVTWSVSGGDPVAGPGRISASGEYTPPSYLTADHA